MQLKTRYSLLNNNTTPQQTEHCEVLPADRFCWINLHQKETDLIIPKKTLSNTALQLGIKYSSGGFNKNQKLLISFNAKHCASFLATSDVPQSQQTNKQKQNSVVKSSGRNLFIWKCISIQPTSSKLFLFQSPTSPFVLQKHKIAYSSHHKNVINAAIKIAKDLKSTLPQLLKRPIIIKSSDS